MNDLSYELRYPIVHKGNEIKSLVIRRPKVRDFEKFKSVNEDYIFTNLLMQAEFFIRECSDLPKGAIDDMDHAGDYSKLVEKMVDFLANDQW